MAKTIKFNLILDNNPVRDIEGLKNNFSIEDIIEYYHNGLLKRWLGVRGYDDYLNKVNNIKPGSNIELIQELINIFDIESDENKIREQIAILDYINERIVLLEEYKKSNYQTSQIVDDYHNGYEEIIKDIIDNHDDMTRIKANIAEIQQNYMGLFKLDYRELFNCLINDAPLAVFAILMNDEMYNYFVDNENANENRTYIYNEIKRLISNKSKLKEVLGKELKIFKGNTEAYWKDIEPQEKSFVIVSIESGNYVRNAGVFGEELSHKEINGSFYILKGIDYKSNNSNHELLYMEV